MRELALFLESLSAYDPDPPFGLVYPKLSLLHQFGAGSQYHIFPAISVRLHFTLEFLAQVIFDGLPNASRSIIPTHSRTNLPGVCLQVRKKRKQCIQIDLNGPLAHTSTGFFAEACQGNM